MQLTQREMSMTIGDWDWEWRWMYDMEFDGRWADAMRWMDGVGIGGWWLPCRYPAASSHGWMLDAPLDGWWRAALYQAAFLQKSPPRIATRISECWWPFSSLCILISCRNLHGNSNGYLTTTYDSWGGYCSLVPLCQIVCPCSRKGHSLTRFVKWMGGSGVDDVLRGGGH